MNIGESTSYSAKSIEKHIGEINIGDLDKM